MLRREIMRFDKNSNQTFMVMSDVITNLGFKNIESDRKIGIIKFTTQKKYLLFGGMHYTLTINKVSEFITEVSITTRDDSNNNSFQKTAEIIFTKMYKKIPIQDKEDKKSVEIETSNDEKEEVSKIMPNDIYSIKSK